jgi:hypothetical protein
MASLAVEALQPIAIGQPGLPLPECIVAAIFVIFCVIFYSLAILSTLGNWLVLFLVLWMLAVPGREHGVFYRLWSTVLVFVPIWGLRYHRRIAGPQ